VALALLLAQPVFAQQSKAQAKKGHTKNSVTKSKANAKSNDGKSVAPSKAGQTGTPYKDLANGLLWRVEGKELSRPSYLFGTFHLQNARFFEKAPAVLSALNETGGVVGEMVMDSTIVMQVAMMTMRPGKQPLNELLSPQELERISMKVNQAHQFDMGMLMKLPPIVTLELLQSEDLKNQFPGMTPEGMNDGMDVSLQNSARSKGKRVEGFETLEQQMNLLMGNLTPERQARMLAEYIVDSVQNAKENQQMVDAYRNGDLNALYTLMRSGDFSKAESDALLKTRNEAWLRELPKMMQAYPRLVVVGALHLAGPDGLIYQLRQRGYTLTPVPLTAE
jgi:uncharacterized protein YbaP (TraB family)